MSGRLVILRHKSWNVWNQDNVTKVRNDELHHKQEEEAKAARSKELLHEQTLDALKRQDTNEESSIETFTLFDNPDCPVLSDRGKKAIGNEDYRKEAESKKLKEARDNGVAPWGFADVSRWCLPVLVGALTVIAFFR